MGTRVVPIPALAITMSASTASAPDAMDVTSSPAASASSHVADRETNGKPSSRLNPLPQGNDRNPADSSSNMPAPPTASSAIHQPKIVQTAFIHKLYK
jgi:hypothetical protein